MSKLGHVVETLRARINPWLVVMGMLLGLFVCQRAGRWCSKHNCYVDFQRFSMFISPSTDFFPTSGQMLAIVKSKMKSDDQVVVIVGGSSIFLGVCQPLDDLWSDELQRLLGADYCVVNLAQRGCPAAGGAMSIAEALRKEGKKVIYTANTPAAACGPPDAPEPYRYIFWDVRGKGKLYDYATRNAKFANEEKEKKNRQEYAIRAWLNSKMHHEDLWTMLAYTRFCTAWNFIIGNRMFEPRKNFIDMELPLPPVGERFKKDEAQIKGLEETLPKITIVDAQGKRVSPPTIWGDLENQIEAAFPNELRSCCLIAVMSCCPHYTHKLEPTLQMYYKANLDYTTEVYHNHGIPSVEVGSKFEDEDFEDYLHHSVTGGIKTAQILAPEIRTIAHKLYGK